MAANRDGMTLVDVAMIMSERYARHDARLHRYALITMQHPDDGVIELRAMATLCPVSELSARSSRYSRVN